MKIDTQLKKVLAREWRETRFSFGPKAVQLSTSSIDTQVGVASLSASNADSVWHPICGSMVFAQFEERVAPNWLHHLFGNERSLYEGSYGH